MEQALPGPSDHIQVWILEVLLCFEWLKMQPLLKPWKLNPQVGVLFLLSCVEGLRKAQLWPGVPASGLGRA